MNYRNNPDCAEIVQTQLMSFANEWKQRTANGNWIGQLDMFYYELSQLFNKKLLVMIDEMESIFYSNRFVSALEEEALYSALRSLIQRHENFDSKVNQDEKTLISISGAYEEMKTSEEVNEMLVHIDKYTPGYQMTDEKKMDFILWALGGILKKR